MTTTFAVPLDLPTTERPAAVGVRRLMNVLMGRQPAAWTNVSEAGRKLLTDTLMDLQSAEIAGAGELGLPLLEGDDLNFRLSLVAALLPAELTAREAAGLIFEVVAPKHTHYSDFVAVLANGHDSGLTDERLHKMREAIAGLSAGESARSISARTGYKRPSIARIDAALGLSERRHERMLDDAIVGVEWGWNAARIADKWNLSASQTRSLRAEAESVVSELAR